MAILTHVGWNSAHATADLYSCRLARGRDRSARQIETPEKGCYNVGFMTFCATMRPAA